jgi:hypothetical protein
MTHSLLKTLAWRLAGVCGVALFAANVTLAQQSGQAGQTGGGQGQAAQGQDAGDLPPGLEQQDSPGSEQDTPPTSGEGNDSSQGQADEQQARQDQERREQQRQSEQGQQDQAQSRDRDAQGQQGQQQGEDRGQQQGQQQDAQANQRPGLGVTLGQEGQQGVRVLGVYPNSPASQAGLQPGDEITRFGEQQVDSVQGLIQVIQQRSPGDTVAIEVARQGQRMEMETTLGSQQEVLGRDARRTSFFRGGMGDTPWSQDDVSQHIQSLEQEIRMLTDEIQDLKQMLGALPDREMQSQDSQRNRGSVPAPPRDSVDRPERRLNRSNQGSDSQNYDFEQNQNQNQ